MRDLRRRALEGNKTVSRKAQSKISSRNSSVAHSPAASKDASRDTSRNVSRHGSDDEDGNLSDGTNWSIHSFDDTLSLADIHDDGTDLWKQDLADRAEEIINRKRSTIQGREAALAAYIYFLTTRYAYDEIDGKVSQLIPALLKSVKSESSEKEACLALKAIALTVITVPSEAIYDALFQTLKRTYTNSESPAVQVAAIHTLGAAAMFAGAADAEIEAIMDDLLEVIESDGASIDAVDSAEVVTAACEVWGFLATAIEDLQDKTEEAMEAFVEQLDSSYPSVQIAAGENIALLYEKSYTEREDDDDPASDEEDEDGLPVDTSMVKRYDVCRQPNQLKHRLNRLANESSRRIAKKDRKTLHANFSDILNTVEHPSRGPRYQKAIDQQSGRRYGSRMVVRIHKSGSMVIDKWWKLHRLQALRRTLGGGFVPHYENNEVIFESLP